MCINLCIASKKVYKRLFEKYSLCKRNLYMNIMNIKLDENVLFKCIYVSLCYSSWHQRSCMSIGDKTTRISGRWGESLDSSDPLRMWCCWHTQDYTPLNQYLVPLKFILELVWFEENPQFFISWYTCNTCTYVQPHLHYSTDLVFMEIHCSTISYEEKNQHVKNLLNKLFFSASR